MSALDAMPLAKSRPVPPREHSAFIEDEVARCDDGDPVVGYPDNCRLQADALLEEPLVRVPGDCR